jgi:glutathione S-transferase
MLTLYYSPGACSLAPHIILEEAGAPFEAVRVTIAEGLTRTPEFLAINPRARVPALAVQGRIVTENAAILTYLGNLFPDARLMPPDLLDEARVQELLSFFASSVHIAFAQIWRAERFTSDEKAHAALQQGGRDALARYFDEIEGLLAGRDWLLPGRFTIADPYPFVFFRWGRRIGMDMGSYPAWQDHSERMLSRPSVQRALAREGLDRAEFLPDAAQAGAPAEAAR